MRHNQNRRSRGRSRKAPNPLTRSFESNGPDVKVRGTAAHVAEKYGILARDAQSAGDRIAAENYFQHAEHYNRIVAAAQAQQVQQNQGRDAEDDDGDEDNRQESRQESRQDNRQDGRNSDKRDDDSQDDGNEQAASGRDKQASGKDDDGERRPRRRARRPDSKQAQASDAETAPSAEQPAIAEQAEASNGGGEDRDKPGGDAPKRKPRKTNGHSAAAAETSDNASSINVENSAPAAAKPADDSGNASGDEEAVTKDGSAALAAFPD